MNKAKEQIWLLDPQNVQTETAHRVSAQKALRRAVGDASLAAIESLLSLEERKLREEESGRRERTAAVLVALPSALAALHTKADHDRTKSWPEVIASAWFLAGTSSRLSPKTRKS
jgi:hypothetical protein